MCLACEQDALWFAYLQRRGLITADGQPIEQPPFVDVPVEQSTPEEKREEDATEPADNANFACDDPTAG